MDFSGKKVLIVGLGTLGGGVGTARFFAQHGAHVHVTDLKSEKELTTSLQILQPFPITYTFGKHDEKDLDGIDLIIKNPSVPTSSLFIQKAREKNIPIEMAESLFMKLSPTKNIIGVTGTRGKSTTSALIYKVLKKAGKKVFLAGNVKDTSTLELLEDIDSDSFVVLELSSWQLESFEWVKKSPRIAVVTNIYPDHLNRYDSIDEYIRAKANIFLHQDQNDHVVLNSDNERTKLFADTFQILSHIHWFSSKSLPDNITLSLAGGGPGGHNRENAAAAYEVCRVILKIDEEIVSHALEEFHGLKGRLEHLGIINGRTVINDTTSTTPTSGIKAIESIQLDQKIVLIVGGNSKNLPIGGLVQAIKNCVKAIVYLKGNGTDALKKELETSGITSAGPFESMHETVSSAFEFADFGDVILFSPSFTSFGQFNNEFERGETYKKEINKLQAANE